MYRFGPFTAKFSSKHGKHFKEQKFQIVTVKNFRKSLMQTQKNKLNDRPRIKSNWAQQKKCLGELAGSAENFPERPQISFRKCFLHSSKQPSTKRAKNAARSQTVMEIPAITSETLTAPKPQQVNKIPVLTILYKKLLLTAENNICRK